GIRVFRPPYRLRPLPTQAPQDEARRRDSAAVLPPDRMRARRIGAGGAGAPWSLLAPRVPPELAHALQRGHPARAAVELLSPRFAGRSPREHLPKIHRRRAALEVLRGDRARVPPRPFPRV